MFFLHEYDIFWAFLIISSFIPILAFVISYILAPIKEGLEKLSSYESSIEPWGMLGYNSKFSITCFPQFLLFLMSKRFFFIFMLIPIVGSVYA